MILTFNTFFFFVFMICLYIKKQLFSFTDVNEEKISSSTMSNSNRDVSQSNFSQIEESAQFRSTKVYYLLLDLLFSVGMNSIVIKKKLNFLFQYPNSTIRGTSGLDGNSLMQPIQSTQTPIDDNSGKNIINDFVYIFILK